LSALAALAFRLAFVPAFRLASSRRRESLFPGKKKEAREIAASPLDESMTETLLASLLRWGQRRLSSIISQSIFVFRQRRRKNGLEWPLSPIFLVRK
jgi:hypothetical protein